MILVLWLVEVQYQLQNLSFGLEISHVLNPSNKDTLIHLAELMLNNHDELENLNKTESGNTNGTIVGA